MTEDSPPPHLRPPGRGRRWLLAGMVASILSGCSLLVDTELQGTSRSELSVGFIYVGPIGDHGWTKTHEDARQYALQNMSGLDTGIAVSVAPADAPRVIDEMVANGRNVIVSTSYSFLEATQNAALNYPDVDFLICSGFRTGPNLGSYFGRMYQVMYLAGVLAGNVTQTNRVGVVGPVVIPETVRHANAFARGVRSVNPQAEVVIDWVEKWFDPPVEEAVTRRVIAAGADVVFGFTDTVGPLQVATATTTADGRPVYAIGYDNPDSCNFDQSPGKDRCLTSAYWNWGPMVVRELEKIRDGTWSPRDAPVWESVQPTPEDSVAYLAPIEVDVPAVTNQMRVEVESLIPSMAAETDAAHQFPFRTDNGDLLDNRGNVRVPEGSGITDQQLLRMCWFVEGIVDLQGLPATVPPACQGDR